MSSDLGPFHSILVPLDGSPLAEQALPLAAELARGKGARLRLVLVHELPPAPRDAFGANQFVALERVSRRGEREYLRRMQQELRTQGIRLSAAATLTGHPGPALAEYARETGSDLIVMTTHGRGGARRAWLGSVADDLIRHSGTPVLLVRAAESHATPVPARAPRQILVPLDGSDLSEQALPVASRLARTWGAELTPVTVVSPVVPADANVPLPSIHGAEAIERYRQDAQEYLEGIDERMREQGIRAEGMAVVGWSAAGAILDLAHPDAVSAIVLATHGRGGLRRWVLGSVADKLIRAAEVPVLVVRPSGSGRQAASPEAEGSLASGRRAATRPRTVLVY
jgi:nucleotide-binding universal stress UspA family protein